MRWAKSGSTARRLYWMRIKPINLVETKDAIIQVTASLQAAEQHQEDHSAVHFSVEIDRTDTESRALR